MGTELIIKDENYILTIEGGGTKTLGRLYSEDGVVINEKITKATNIRSEKIVDVINTLTSLIESLLCNIPKEKIFVSVGMAGAGNIESKLQYENIFKDMGFNKILISTDADIALVGAHGKAEGGLLISGTGSIAYYLKNGVQYRVGGWGHILGDEGSGYFIGLEALKATTKICDGRLSYSPIKDKIFNHFKINALSELITIVYNQIGKKEIAELARYVFEINDELCKKIIDDSTDDLVELVRTLKKQIGSESIHLCLTGGIIENDTPVREMFLNKIKSEGITIKEKIGDGCYGAYILAKLSK